MHFDASYREELTLRDDSRVVIRQLTPADRPGIAEAFTRLSDQGRYQRFFIPKSKLTDRELDYLTDVDQQHHVALVAVVVDDGVERGGAGVGRCVELADEPGVAEAAITVVDAMQGKGLGTALLCRLIRAARERGIREFRAEVLTINDRMKSVLRDVAPEAHMQVEGEVTHVGFELANALSGPCTPAEGPMYRMLRRAADRALSIRRVLTWRES